MRDSSNVLTSDDIPLPDGFPAPRLALPRKGFAPDYFVFGIYHFCSRRLRDARAQPEHVIQFTPVDLVDDGEEARAQDYRLRRVLAQQPAMDLDRSDCKLEDSTNRITGETTKYPRWVERFVLLDGLRAQTEIFRMAETPTDVLVVDALAERVLRARCTGMAFSDPAKLQHAMHVERYRTATGTGERNVGF